MAAISRFYRCDTKKESHIEKNPKKSFNIFFNDIFGISIKFLIRWDCALENPIFLAGKKVSNVYSLKNSKIQMIIFRSPGGVNTWPCGPATPISRAKSRNRISSVVALNRILLGTNRFNRASG
jgi:hypothetical protein